MKTKNVIASVIDTNGKRAGKHALRIVIGKQFPLVIYFKGDQYGFTGKTGKNHRTGSYIDVWEMATEDDVRLWVNGDGSQIWQD